MSYTKQNFQTGAVLTAAQLNAMDDQIAANETAAAKYTKPVVPEQYGAIGDGEHDDARHRPS